MLCSHFSKCERADTEAARSRFEMLGEDLGADDDERDTSGERRHREDRRHRGEGTFALQKGGGSCASSRR